MCNSQNAPLYILRGHRLILYKKHIVFLCYLKIDFTNSVDPLMKCSIMLHFIRVFTVCQSTQFRYIKG